MPIELLKTDGRKARVAIIHDWLIGFRGGEQVLDAFVELFPESDLFTLFYERGKVNPRIESRPIRSSFLNRLPSRTNYYRHLLPLFPLAIEQFDLSSYDFVLSSSHCVAKGVIPSPGALHICYSHTPMRYAWDRNQDYFGNSRLSPLIAPFLHYLRNWDVTSSARVDAFIANSSWTQKRIEKYYRRKSGVINPFVNLEKFPLVSHDRHDYYLVVSAFAPYKRLDLAIEACERLGKKLLVVGEGAEERSLKRLAKSHTQFLPRQRAEDLQDLYAGAKALLFPGEEDFGITPVEAMACGIPVLAYGRGGILDSVIPDQTGLFFPEQTLKSMISAIQQFESTPFKDRKFTAQDCRKRALEFSREKFLKDFTKQISTLWNGHVALITQNICSTPQFLNLH